MSVVINGSAGVTTNSGAVYNGISAGTAVASTSGTSIDFTSIPSWVKRITVMFNGVSTSGSSVVQVQLGAGSPTTTGYTATGSVVTGTASVAVTSFTSGFGLDDVGNAAYTRSGNLIIDNLSGNIWCASFSLFAQASTARTHFGGGSVTLSGTLDRIRITTVNGTDAFDAGSINILYE